MSASAVGEWGRLPSIPDREGFAGSFAGVSHGRLLVAGGANFPDKRPWEGGVKVWYDSVFALDDPKGTWEPVGRLPRPLGYGFFATYRDKLVCVGGSDKERHYAEAFSLEVVRGELVTQALPSLPLALSDGCGALVGSTLYVVGGQETLTGVATNRAFALDLSAKAPAWVELPRLPGPSRILAVSASFEGRLYVFGGAELFLDGTGALKRNYLRDAFCFSPKQGWRRLAGLPRPIVAAPSPAPTSESAIYVLGGDDGSLVGTPQKDHPGFPKRVLRYEPKTDRWTDVPDAPVSRATAPIAQWGKQWVIAGGEARPGVRSPEVWSFQPK